MYKLIDSVDVKVKTYTEWSIFMRNIKLEFLHKESGYSGMSNMSEIKNVFPRVKPEVLKYISKGLQFLLRRENIGLESNKIKQQEALNDKFVTDYSWTIRMSDNDIQMLSDFCGICNEVDNSEIFALITKVSIHSSGTRSCKMIITYEPYDDESQVPLNKIVSRATTIDTYLSEND